MRILKITLENVRYETEDKLSFNELIKSYNEHAGVLKQLLLDEILNECCSSKKKFVCEYLLSQLSDIQPIYAWGSSMVVEEEFQDGSTYFTFIAEMAMDELRIVVV